MTGTDGIRKQPERISPAALLTLLLAASAANAATFLVNETSDQVDANPGDGVCDIGDGVLCTLRAAIQEANALAGSDTIDFFLSGQTYALALDGGDDVAAVGDLDITEDLTINGNDNFVDAQFLDSPIDNAFEVHGGVAVAIHELTIQNAGLSGIRNESGDVTLTDSTVRLNGTGITVTLTTVATATVDLSGTSVESNTGLGISATGLNLGVVSVSVTDGSSISSNAGGIQQLGGSLVVTDSFIESNVGPGSTTSTAGGIDFTTDLVGAADVVAISGSEIRSNSNSAAAGVGGVLVTQDFSTPDPTVTVTGSIFEGNSGPFAGGLRAFGDVTITGSRFDSNVNTSGFTPAPGGVGLSIGIPGGPQASVSTTTFVGNSGGDGAALVTQQPLEMSNSTFSGNTASGSGTAAIYCRTADAVCDFEDVTVTGTTGGGGNAVKVDAAASLTLGNSILASSSGFDCLGTISSAGFNLIEEVGCAIAGDTTGNLHDVDPLLDALADNGGATETHALLPGSPALDGGPAACTATSQNGVVRPQDGDGNGSVLCDIGAFEAETGTVPSNADLSIAKDDGLTEVLPGQAITYTIVAANAGPANALGTSVADTFPAELESCSWTCAGGGGGVCTTGPVAGDIADAVDLPVGGSVTYTVECTVDLGSSGTLENTAGVAPPPWVTDGEASNDSATDTDAILALDYGDAPDPTYPTLAASDGARHVTGALFLGALVDSESDGQPSAGATGDDVAASDDEDGVSFSSGLLPGTTADLEVTASAPGALSAWIDFNADGDWDDAGEQVFADEALAAGANDLEVAVPAGAVPGDTFARFRFSSETGLGVTGQAADGEVEDHPVTVVEPLDYGDAPDPGYPTLLASDGARHGVSARLLGSAIDVEADGQPSADADGDDLDGTDDEDGVAFVSAVVAGGQSTIEVTITQSGFLNAWVDFDADGDWQDAGEQIFSDQFLSTVGAHELSFPVPGDAAAGETFARFRFGDSGLGITGEAADGEVEDYRVTVFGASDWGDAPDPLYPTLAASGGASHGVAAGLHLGSAVDGEDDGQPTAAADGDDADADGDDEDGVVFTSVVEEGTTATVDVTASDAGLLNAWIDFNDDGDWADPGEQIFTDEPLAAGVNGLSFEVPDGLSSCDTFARFRFDSGGGLSFGGPADDGEVEDHPVTVTGDGPYSLLRELPVTPSAGVDLDGSFGMRLGRSGDTIVVSAPLAEVSPSFNRGVAYIFERDQGGSDNWGQVKELQGTSGHQFGTGLAIDGDVIAVGEHLLSSVHIFERDQGGAGNWGLVTTVTPSQGGDGAFGISVALDGDRLVVGGEGAFGANAPGVVYIFERDQGGPGNWGEVRRIVPDDSAANDFFGRSVALSADWLAVTAPGPNKVYFFQRDEGGTDNWGQKRDFSGREGVALDGDRAVIGSGGFAEVFGKDVGGIDNWGEIADLLPSPSAVDYGAGLHIFDGLAGVGAGGDFDDAPFGFVFRSDKGGPDAWGEVQAIELDLGFDPIGRDVGIHVSGDLVVLGNPGADKAWVYSGISQPPPADELDFGDAPDPDYPTLLANDGARHVLGGGLFLGASADADADGQPNPTATGDDADGTDDEDGVTFTSLLVTGSQATVDVLASGPGLLNAWVDFDVDGSWGDPGEQVFTDEALVAGVNSLSFPVPVSATVTASTFARFRYDSAGGLPPTGAAADGEVEDYEIAVVEAPTADAGLDRTISPETESVLLGGMPAATGGTPPYGFFWAVTPGTPGVDFALGSETEENPFFTGLTEGVYTATLTVTDANALEHMDSAAIAVEIPEQRDLFSEDLTGMQTYEACERITAELTVIKDGAQIVFMAPVVELLAGFTVEQGATFEVVNAAPPSCP